MRALESTPLGETHESRSVSVCLSLCLSHGSCRLAEQPRRWRYTLIALATLGALSGCSAEESLVASQALVAAEPESSVERTVASIEDDLDRITDPEERLAERRRRFEEEMQALRVASIDEVDSYDQQVALRNRLMGSDEAHADAMAAAQAAFARHESYVPTAGDLELTDLDRARARALRDEYARADADEYTYPPPPPMPEDVRERDRLIEEERRRINGYATSETREDEVSP